jgi:hypothetical protein
MKHQKQITTIENIISILATLAFGSMIALGFANIGMGQTANGDDQGVTVTVKGESWDADSRGFAYYGGLSKTEGEKTSARRGSRISVDSQPDKYAIASPGPGFELTFTTKEPSFRLIVDGDRFPRVITQPYKVPDGGGVIDIGRIDALRAEGAEHTWPLVLAANELGYTTAWEMLADNKAAIRLLVLGSGEEGAPEWTDYPYYYLFYLGHSHYLLGNNEEAIKLMKRVVTRAPYFLPVRRHLAVLFVEAGLKKEARAQTAEVLRIFPGASIEDERQRCYYRWEPALQKRFFTGLRKSGMPEGRRGEEPMSMD